MANFLTTRQLQELLQVDRTTIYRMADSGRLPGLKVGNQWRFPQQQVESWLATQSAQAWGNPAASTAAKATAQADAQPPATSSIRDLLPIECVQQIQNTFADAFGVMFVITDLAGNLVTAPSNPCGLYTATEASPVARQRCIQLWSDLANAPSLQPAFVESHLGLLCARGLIKVGSELRAMLVVGGIAPVQWPPVEARIREIATYLAMDAATVARHIDEVHRVSPQEQARILAFVQRIADIIAHIITERNQLFAKLQDIAELTKI